MDKSPHHFFLLSFSTALGPKGGELASLLSVGNDVGEEENMDSIKHINYPLLHTLPGKINFQLSLKIFRRAWDTEMNCSEDRRKI